MVSRHEIHLSETARTDFDRLQSQAESSPDALRQLLEVYALLDQLAEADSAHDHVVPGSSPEPALRYRSEGGVYMYFRRLKATNAVVVAFFCETQVGAAAQSAHRTSTGDVAAPGQPRLLDFQLRDIPHGMEAGGTMEFTGEDGSRKTRRSFIRKVDWGDSYTFFHNFAVDAQPARTMITSGQKGETEGDWRRDTIEVVELLADGTALRFPPQTVPVWIRNPFYEGTSTKDMLARMEKDAIWKTRIDQIKALLDKDSGAA